MKLSPRLSLAALTAALTLIPGVASATNLNIQTNVSTAGTELHTSAHVEGSVASTTHEPKEHQGEGTDAKARADAEINKRIESFNKVLTRFGQMKKLSSTEQASLKATIDAQIASLTALKAKIDADATTTLKEDIKSITKGFRTYVLVLPQSRVLAAADRIQGVVSQMNTIDTKLQARITAAQTVGKDVSAANTAYADFHAKISDASAQATAAVSMTSGLKPDNGDATIAASNKTALSGAADKIKAATKDLVQARADIEVIVKATQTNK